jgi:hypothetical protein
MFSTQLGNRAEPPMFEPAGVSLVPSPAERLKDLAWACRVLAHAIHDENSRRELVLSAERADRLAEVQEKGKVPARSYGAARMLEPA